MANPNVQMLLEIKVHTVCFNLLSAEAQLAQNENKGLLH